MKFLIMLLIPFCVSCYNFTLMEQAQLKAITRYDEDVTKMITVLKWAYWSECNGRLDAMTKVCYLKYTDKDGKIPAEIVMRIEKARDRAKDIMVKRINQIDKDFALARTSFIDASKLSVMTLEQISSKQETVKLLQEWLKKGNELQEIMDIVQDAGK